MRPVLAVERLGLRFGGVVALAGVSLTVDRSERLALLGPNGAGKTSILNCISGVERPTTGRISVDGRDVAGLRPSARAAMGVARTLQALALVDTLDVLGNLLLGRHHLSHAGLVATALRLRRVRVEESAQRRHCEAIVDELGLAGERGTPAGELPPGARKRLELGRALAMEPALLLLDEPFAGAGSEDVEIMVGAIRRASAAGIAVVLVDHDVAAVTGLVDRAMVLDAGRVVTAGPVSEVQRHPAVVSNYLGARAGAG